MSSGPEENRKFSSGVNSRIFTANSQSTPNYGDEAGINDEIIASDDKTFKFLYLAWALNEAALLNLVSQSLKISIRFFLLPVNNFKAFKNDFKLDSFDEVTGK